MWPLGYFLPKRGPSYKYPSPINFVSASDAFAAILVIIRFTRPLLKTIQEDKLLIVSYVDMGPHFCLRKSLPVSLVEWQIDS